jgi:hypothetical protein
MNHLGNPFSENERQQRPPQQAQLAQKFSNSNVDKQDAQKQETS